MAITATTAANYAPSWSSGQVKYQLMDWSALSAATSGTVTANNLGRLYHILVLGGKLTHTAAPTYATNVATLAFTVPAETAASRVIDGITYTATANQGAGGNAITVELVDGTGDMPPVTKGTETVFVVGKEITVHIDPTPVSGSAQTDVRVAVNLSAAAAALVTATGTSAAVASVTAPTALQNGVTGGARGTLICIGTA